MAYPEDNEVGPEELEGAKELTSEEMRQELTARGYTEVDFEKMEMRAKRLLEVMRVEAVMNRYHREFVRRVVFGA